MHVFILAALFLSTSAFACPVLTGEYATCRSESDDTATSYNVMVTQSVTNQITTYKITSTNDSQETHTETYKADGRTVVATERDPESGMTIQLATTVSCTGAKSLDIKMNFRINGELAASMSTAVTKADGKMKMVMVSTSPEGTQKNTIVCEIR